MTTNKIALKSIRSRTTVAFSAVFCLLLILSGSALIAYIRRDIYEDADRLLTAICKRVGNEMETEHVTDPDELIGSEQTVYGEGLCLLLLNQQGDLVARSSKTQMTWPLLPNGEWRTHKIKYSGGSIVVGMNWTKSQNLIRTQTAAITLFSGFLLAAVSLGAWVLVGKTLSPIRLLSNQAQTAAGNTPGARLLPPSDDSEILELVSTLNSMLDTTNAAAAARGRFYAAASHELRTPLQALSGHLELAASQYRTQEEYAAAVVEAHQQTRRLVNLTRDLLVLNQVESTTPPPDEQVSIAENCEQMISLLNTVAIARSLSFDFRSDCDASIAAPITHIDMILRNLLENAVKYAEPGNEISVRITANPRPTLRIFNRSQPVSGWIPERTFEAFYRPDPSRSSGTGGNGLGLAICKAVCVLNGWDIHVGQVDGGVLAEVEF